MRSLFCRWNRHKLLTLWWRCVRGRSVWRDSSAWSDIKWTGATGENRLVIEDVKLAQV